MTTIHTGLEAGLGLVPDSTDKTRVTQSRTADRTSQPQAPAAPGQPVEVNITPAAQLLSGLEQQLAGTPAIDQSRVNRISQALSGGSYPIDAGRIADGLIAAQKFDAQAGAGPASGTQSSTLKAFTATAQLGPDRN